MRASKSIGRRMSRSVSEVSDGLNRAKTDHQEDAGQSPALADVLDKEQRAELVYVVHTIMEAMHDIICLQKAPSRNGNNDTDQASPRPADRGRNDEPEKPRVTVKELGIDGEEHAQFEEWRLDMFIKLKDAIAKPPLNKQGRNGEDEFQKGIYREGKSRSPEKVTTDIDDQHLMQTKKDAAQPSMGLPRFYEVVDTELSKLPERSLRMVLQALLALCLTDGKYNANSRVMMLYLVSSLLLSVDDLVDYEIDVSKKLIESASQMSGEEEKDARIQKSKSSKKWKIGVASAAGAIAVGLTGGLAAPMVAAGLGTLMGGLGMGAGYLGAVAGSSVLVGGLFGAYGGRMTGRMMERYAKEVEDFAFLPVQSTKRPSVGKGSTVSKEKSRVQSEEEKNEIEMMKSAGTRRLRVTIAITGWLTEESDFVEPWRVLGDDSEVFALRWEYEALFNLGNSFWSLVKTGAWSAGTKVAAKNTVFGPMLGAVLWPMGILKLGALVDNPFKIGSRRADKAGEILADAIINKAQGERPVNLVGYSLGARVIYSCLKSLADRKAFGLVESAILIGAPCPSDPPGWVKMRSVVSGRLVNVFSSRDAILKFLFRATSLQYGIAGLSAVKRVDGVENYDMTDTVSGHLRYHDMIGSILETVGVDHLDAKCLKVEKERLREQEKSEEKELSQKLENMSLEERQEAEKLVEGDEEGRVQGDGQAPDHESQPESAPSTTLKGDGR
ncbi:hypothetical protein KEM55_000969 [Ascosphaera atra]|nr:hypothetical protein KEM55_000969 [Ascosphaera atra]